MKACPYCQREFNDKGLSLHIWKAHQKQLEAKKEFAKQEIEIPALVHAEVVAKRREFALAERRQALSRELQSLANDMDNLYKPLTICNVCGGTWDNHKDGCPFKQTKSGLDEFLDFMASLLSMGGQQ